jgi:hypothetical protein
MDKPLNTKGDPAANLGRPAQPLGRHSQMVNFVVIANDTHSQLIIMTNQICFGLKFLLFLRHPYNPLLPARVPSKEN